MHKAIQKFLKVWLLPWCPPPPPLSFLSCFVDPCHFAFRTPRHSLTQYLRFWVKCWTGGWIHLFLFQIPRFGLVWTTQRFYLLAFLWMINYFVSIEVSYCRHFFFCLCHCCCVGWGPACYVVEFKQIWYFEHNFWFAGNTLEHFVFNFSVCPHQWKELRHARVHLLM